jgi:hypothetical protein
MSLLLHTYASSAAAHACTSVKPGAPSRGVSSVCRPGRGGRGRVVVTTAHSSHQRAFAPSQAPRRVVQVAASGSGFAAGMSAAAAAGGAAAASPATLEGVSFADSAPSWETLAARVAELKSQHGQPAAPDYENGVTTPHALVRRFGTTEVGLTLPGAVTRLVAWTTPAVIS